MLTFTLKAPLQVGLTVNKLVPNQLIGKSIDEIKRVVLPYGKMDVEVGELFGVQGNNTGHLNFENTSPKMYEVGAGMENGIIEIQGNVGDYVGKGMRGGKLIAHGNTRDFTACDLRDGFLEIKGNTGDFLGAKSQMSFSAMNGGTVVVRGNAGNRLGDQMRRGLILVAGNVGDFCASQMKAGTIIVNGNLGKLPCYLMKRGTLLVTEPVDVLPMMQNCGVGDFLFLQLLYRYIRNLPVDFSLPSTIRAKRWMGDVTIGGKGEVLEISCEL